MQPERASRGIAAVALSSAACGLVLLVLAVVLTACGASSSGRPAPSSDPAASTSAASGSGAVSAPVGTPASAAPGTATSTPSSAAPTDPTPVATVPTVAVTTAPAVALDVAAPAAGGGRISIGAITSIQGTAQLPGEIAGPAVRVPVTIVAGTGGALDLDQVVVDLVDASGVSAGQLSAAPAAPFSGTLAPGATANAVYVFTLATDDRRDVRINLSYTTAAPVVVFTGTIA